MDSAELSEWIAYWSVHPPFDPWYAVGLVCSTMVRLFSKSKAKPSDFMPKRRQPKKKRMSGRQIKERMGMFLARFKGDS